MLTHTLIDDSVSDRLTVPTQGQPSCSTLFFPFHSLTSDRTVRPSLRMEMTARKQPAHLIPQSSILQVLQAYNTLGDPHIHAFHDRKHDKEHGRGHPDRDQFLEIRPERVRIRDLPREHASAQSCMRNVKRYAQRYPVRAFRRTFSSGSSHAAGQRNRGRSCVRNERSSPRGRGR